MLLSDEAVTGTVDESEEDVATVTVPLGISEVGYVDAPEDAAGEELGVSVLAVNEVLKVPEVDGISVVSSVALVRPGLEGISVLIKVVLLWIGTETYENVISVDAVTTESETRIKDDIVVADVM